MKPKAELKQLQNALTRIERWVADDFAADLEWDYAQDRLKTDRERELAKRMGKIYMIAHSSIRSHSCYKVHDNWRE